MWITLAADLPGVTACGLLADHYRSPEGRIRQIKPARQAADESGTGIGPPLPSTLTAVGGAPLR